LTFDVNQVQKKNFREYKQVQKGLDDLRRGITNHLEVQVMIRYTRMLSNAKLKCKCNCFIYQDQIFLFSFKLKPDWKWLG